LKGRAAAGLILAGLAVALGLYLLRERQIAGSLGASGFPLDDSWIHLQFARNLAEGRGFSYNPGVSVPGSTAPLWTLLLAGLFAIAGAHLAWVKIAGMAAAVGSAWLARRLAIQWTGEPLLGLGAGVVTALSAPMVWGALSGMEVTLAALLVTGALCAHASGRVTLAALLIGAAALARPESVLLVPLLWLGGPLTLKRSLASLGIPVAVLSPWIAFNLWTAGTPLPATAAAKIEGGLVGLLAGTREPMTETLFGRPWRFEAEWATWLLSVDVLLPILILPGLWMLWRRHGRAALLPASILLLHPLGMALLAPYRGPAFQEGRYSIQLLPLAICVAVTALSPSSLSPQGRGQGEGWLRRAIVVLFLAASVVPLWSGAGRYAWAVQNIDAMQVHLGRWVSEQTPPGARLALNDVGAIGYFGRREAVDVMGLVTPAIIPYRREGEKGVLRYLERACPDYLIIFPAWFPELASRGDRFTPVYRVRLERNTVAGADEMVVYETAWNRWSRVPRPCPERP
jgi:arabinofuranosyltransferase